MLNAAEQVFNQACFVGQRLFFLQHRCVTHLYILYSIQQVLINEPAVCSS
jgi:hypothetical protein